MRFADPSILWLLLLVPFMGLLFWMGTTYRRRRLQRFASGAMLGHLARGLSSWRPVTSAILRIVAVGFVVVALARPQWGRKDEPVVRRGVDVVLVLDLSESMLAEDVSPSRLEQAKAAAGSLLQSLAGDRVGLVVFGGRATVQCPLTLDYGAVRLFLDAAEPSVSPGAGSDLGRAIDEASRLFSASERRYKAMVLLTDGEDLEAHGLAAAKKAHEDGVVIHALGVGTQGGGPIPLRDENGTLTAYKKDHQGRVVTTRYDPAGLDKIALAADGIYLHAGAAGEEGRRIAEAIAGMEKKEISSRLATRYEDRYQIPLALALLLTSAETLLIGRRWREVRRTAGDVAMGGARKGTERKKGAMDERPRPDPAPKGVAVAGAAASAVAGLLVLAAALVAAGSSVRADESAQGGAGAPAPTPGAAGDAGTSAGAPPAAAESSRRGTPPGSSTRATSGSSKGAASGSSGIAENGKGTGASEGADAPGTAAQGAPRETRPVPAEAARKNREANRLYEKGRYHDALARYEEASAASPETPSLRYNLANALYREGKFDAAAAEYARALSRAGAQLAPSALYNLGNTEYHQGNFQEAADAYRGVLAKTPQDESARRNLELALRMMKQQQQKQDKNQDDKKQQQEQKQDKKQNQKQNQDQDHKEQDKDQQQQDQKNQQDQQKQDQKQENQPGDQEQDASSQMAQKPQPQPQDAKGQEGKIGKKEAEKLLDSLAQEEKRDLKKRLARLPQQEGPEKDW